MPVSELLLEQCIPGEHGEVQARTRIELNARCRPRQRRPAATRYLIITYVRHCECKVENANTWVIIPEQRGRTYGQAQIPLRLQAAGDDP